MRTELQKKYYLGDGEHYFTVRADRYSGQPLVELYKDGIKGRLYLWNASFDDLEKHHPIINHAEVWVMLQAKKEEKLKGK